MHQSDDRPEESDSTGPNPDPDAADPTTDAAANGPTRRRGRSRATGARAAVRETAVVVVTALVLSLVVKTFLLQAFFIPSESMEQTLLRGDRVVVSKLTPTPFDVRRGDVVVFEDPGGWLPPGPPDERGPLARGIGGTLSFIGLLPPAEGNHLIKRVIGVGGDRVICCDDDGRITVNGVGLDETYVSPGDVPSTYDFDVTVPDGRVWVMGDHRSASEDSRFHPGDPGGGAVSVDRVVGRAVALVWPLGRISRLSTDGGVFADVPAP